VDAAIDVAFSREVDDGLNITGKGGPYLSRFGDIPLDELKAGIAFQVCQIFQVACLSEVVEPRPPESRGQPPADSEQSCCR